VKTVRERALAIATFRFVEVRLMEIAAAWTPTTPEMEVKVLLGKHIWDFARHADALGKRTFELRLPEQSSRTPVAGYVKILEDLAALRETPARLAGLHGVVLSGMERRYARYIEETDRLLDAPSVVIIEEILQGLTRQRREADALRQELRLPVERLEELRRRDDALDQIAVLGDDA
jgi:hypothetical protein